MICGLKMFENQEDFLTRLASCLCVAGLSFRVSNSLHGLQGVLPCSLCAGTFLSWQLVNFLCPSFCVESLHY